MKLTRLFVLACAVTCATSPAVAHEFWIEPPEFQVETDAPFVADLRNGELFKGSAQAFFDNRNTRIEAIIGAQSTPITGRMGDRPAIQLPAPQTDGLMVLAHEAAPSTITYKEWAKFMKFVDHKDFKQAEAIHTQRGWDKEGFKEVYTRHSKSLVAVGSGEGSDRALGLVTEFVALDNPYAAGFDGTLDVALLYNGAPRRDAQIEVYARDAEDVVIVHILRTDDQGHAAIPVEAGLEYLLDAVVLRPAADATTVADGPVWETLWASMTFAVPAR
jgi:cobalt/nickel transport protein